MRMIRLAGAEVRGPISIPAEGVRATWVSGAAVVLFNLLLCSSIGLYHSSLFFPGLDSIFPWFDLLDVGDGLAEAAVQILYGPPEPVLVVVKVGAGPCIAPLSA